MSLFIGGLCFPPFALRWICWVEVRGSQCHVSGNISWLHRLSLLVCLEISSVAWLRSQGSMRVGVKAQGAFTQNCIFCEVTFMPASSLWKSPAQQVSITSAEKNTNNKFLHHQLTLQPWGKASQATLLLLVASSPFPYVNGCNFFHWYRFSNGITRGLALPGEKTTTFIWFRSPVRSNLTLLIFPFSNNLINKRNIDICYMAYWRLKYKAASLVFCSN